MANPSPQYVQAEAKGRLLFERLERRLNGPHVHDRVQADIEINYKSNSLGVLADLGTAALENALFNENIDVEGWVDVSVTSSGRPDPAYSNFISAPQGSILCINNNKLEDHNAPESRLEWSDIIFQVYQMEAAKKLQSLRRLRTIWRCWIVNPDTRKILGEARVHSSPEDECLPYIEYRPGGTKNDGGFFALLGRPNGSGIVRMLTDHCSALGNKTIESVRVLNSRDTIEPPTMYFVLADVAITTPAKSLKRSAAGQRRDAKRQKKSESGGLEGPRLLGNA